MQDQVSDSSVSKTANVQSAAMPWHYRPMLFNTFGPSLNRHLPGPSNLSNQEKHPLSSNTSKPACQSAKSNLARCSFSPGTCQPPHCLKIEGVANFPYSGPTKPARTPLSEAQSYLVCYHPRSTSPLSIPYPLTCPFTHIFLASPSPKAPSLSPNHRTSLATSPTPTLSPPTF